MRKFTRSRLVSLVMLVCLTVSITSCASVGKSFPEAAVKDIQIGTTTKNDMLAIFGEPWRTGLEDGQETWTYGRYTYRAFKNSESSDLVIRFDKNGIVTSYAYSATNPKAVK